MGHTITSGTSRGSPRRVWRSTCGSSADSACPTTRTRRSAPTLESTVWPELRESADARGAQAGLLPDELDELDELLRPTSERYVIDEPGYYLVHPTILATGRAPSPQRPALHGT